VIPRKAADFENNDEIYVKLENHDKGEVIWRNDEDMFEECAMIKEKIQAHNLI